MGFFLPDQWLKAKIDRRKAQIKRELPYVLNSIAVMSEAGLNLMPAIQEVSSKEESELSSELKRVDRKSTRLNSSHVAISYAVFCLKKKKFIDNRYKRTY